MNASDSGIGTVRLRVADLDAAREFYTAAIGLRVLSTGSGEIRLGAPGGERALVELVGEPGAPPRPPRTTGLFHLAILVPTRAGLAESLRRLLGAGWRLYGASDHLVSEALYLDDPEGNGIEIYRDRPRKEWQHNAAGELQMATLPLDLDDLLAEADPGDGGEGAGSGVERAAGSGGGDGGIEAGSRIGHVHLQVGELQGPAAYFEQLGFEITVRSYPGALFLGAGGYHHHIGLNTWASAGAPPPPPGSRGLIDFEVLSADSTGQPATQRVDNW